MDQVNALHIYKTSDETVVINKACNFHPLNLRPNENYAFPGAWSLANSNWTTAIGADILYW